MYAFDIGWYKRINSYITSTQIITMQVETNVNYVAKIFQNCFVVIDLNKKKIMKNSYTTHTV